jgi:tetratricopeptide (TPR) repeat protein
MSFTLVLVLFLIPTPGQAPPALAAKHFSQGLAYLQAGQLQKAEEELRHVVEFDPANGQALSLLGSIYDELGDHAKAHTFFLKAIEAEPLKPAAHNNLGISCLRQNRIQEARQAFTRALELDSRSVAAHYNLGLLLMKTGETGESITHLEQARLLKPDDPGILFNLAKAYSQAGNVNSAIPVLRALDRQPASSSLHEVQNLLGTALAQQGQLDEAIIHLGKASTLDPAAPDPHYKLALAFHKKGKMDEALREAQTAVKLQRPPSAPQYVALGMIHQARGETDHASRAFAEALEIAPNADATRFALAILLRNAARYQEAIREFERIRAVRPSSELDMDVARTYYLAGDFPRAVDVLRRTSLPDNHSKRVDYYELLAKIQGKMEQWPEALESLDKAIELDPRHPRLYFDIGVVLLNLNALQQAEQLFRGVLKHLPDSPEIHAGLAQALMLQDHYPEALEALTRAIRLNSGYGEAYFLLGNCLSETGQHEQARRAYQRAIELSPERDDFHFSLASLLEKLGEEDAALAEFEKVIVWNPKSADGHFRLGRLYLQRSDHQRAEVHLHQAIELKPRDSQGYDQLARVLFRTGRHGEAQQALEKLQQLKKTASTEEQVALAVNPKPVEQYLRFLNR